MSRSLKKGPHLDEKLIRKVDSMGKASKEPVKTWSRSCTIVPDFVGGWQTSLRRAGYQVWLGAACGSTSNCG